MMSAMPRPRPPHLHREVTRHGTGVWYVRVGHGPRIRIKAEFGTPEFDLEYTAAIEGKTAPRKSIGPESGSLAWLLDRYRETKAWSNLSPATRRQRDNIFVHVIDAAGTKPFVKINEASIIAGREKRANTPAQARNFLDAMRGLFRWAKKAGMVKIDSTASVENPPKPKGHGFVAWTEADVEAYERRWPIGTKERVWLDVLLYTGLRRGDAVRFGRQHVRDGVGTIKVEKSRYSVEATLPILPVLAATLKAGPCADLAFICGANGKPLTKESFGNEFRRACNEAGVKASAHGVRKIAATRAANAGATTEQLKAIFSWTDDAMPSLYTKSADRRRMAIDAMHKLGGEPVTIRESKAK